LTCRAAIVWATWDLIALVENGRHDGSPTHSVCFVWNSGREVSSFSAEVLLSECLT